MTRSEDRISVEFLRECFEYRDGRLYWRERPAHHFGRTADRITFLKKSAGKPAGRNEPKGYMCVKMRIEGHPVCLSVHRIVWAIHHGTWPEHTIDHINRERRDNRIENLRDIPLDENLRNRANVNATGLLGAYKSGGRFTSTLNVGPTKVYLGMFETPEEASAAYVGAMEAAAAVASAHRNFPDPKC